MQPLQRAWEMWDKMNLGADGCPGGMLASRPCPLLQNKKYVLVLADPDTPSREKPWNQYWRHWLVADIPVSVPGHRFWGPQGMSIPVGTAASQCDPQGFSVEMGTVLGVCVQGSDSSSYIE